MHKETVGAGWIFSFDYLKSIQVERGNGRRCWKLEEREDKEELFQRVERHRLEQCPVEGWEGGTEGPFQVITSFHRVKRLVSCRMKIHIWVSLTPKLLKPKQTFRRFSTLTSFWYNSSASSALEPAGNSAIIHVVAMLRSTSMAINWGRAEIRRHYSNGTQSHSLKVTVVACLLIYQSVLQ